MNGTEVSTGLWLTGCQPASQPLRGANDPGSIMSETIKVVSWNIFRLREPWPILAKMAQCREADVALLQEAGNPPADLSHPIRYGSDEYWKQHLHNDRPLHDR